MKLLTTFSVFIFLCSLTFGQDSTRYKLIVFSGSDWCGTCIKLKSETLKNNEVNAFLLDNKIEQYIADFPRKKANKPAKEVIIQNEKLAEDYNQEGAFPKLILLDRNNTVIYTKNGFITSDVLMKELRSIISE